MIELEAAIVHERLNRLMVADASLHRLVISTIPSQSIKSESTKKAVKAFDEIVKRTM